MVSLADITMEDTLLLRLHLINLTIAQIRANAGPIRRVKRVKTLLQGTTAYDTSNLLRLLFTHPLTTHANRLSHVQPCQMRRDGCVGENQRRGSPQELMSPHIPSSEATRHFDASALLEFTINLPPFCSKNKPSTAESSAAMCKFSRASHRNASRNCLAT